MNQLGDRLAKEFTDKEYRHGYADDFLNTSIAAQIKALRDQRGWTQDQLAERAGMRQSRISAMEDINYTSWSVRTLARLAEAFDVALAVCFKGFTARVADIERFSPDALRVLPYTEDLLLSFGINAPPRLSEASSLAPLVDRLIQDFIGFESSPTPAGGGEIQEHAVALLAMVERMYGKASRQYREFQGWVLGLLEAVAATAQSRIILSKEQEEQAIARINEIDAEIARLTEENREIRERARQDIALTQQAAQREIARIRAQSQQSVDAINQAAARAVEDLGSMTTAISGLREGMNRLAAAAVAASASAS